MPASTQDSKPSNKARKNKKRKQHKNKQDSTSLITGVNKIEVGGKKKKDVSEIIYYNCNKKGDHATKYLEPQKSKN